MVRPTRAVTSVASRPVRGQAYTSSYKKEATELVKAERSKTNPLQFVLDFLQRGQYLTANMVDEIRRSTPRSGDTDKWYKDVYDVLKAGVWEGLLTGKRKGSFTDIIEKDVEGKEREGRFFEPILKSREGKFLGKPSAAKVVGFFANIFLDPATYASFGATGIGKAAIQNFGDDVVKIVSKSLGSLGDDVTKVALKKLASVSDDVLKGMGKGFDVAKFKKLVAESTTKGQKYLKSFKGNTAATMNTLHKNAVLHARSTAPDVLQKELAGGLGLHEVSEMGHKALRVAPGMEGLEDPIRHALSGYQGMGETGLRFMGKDYFKKVRPQNPISRSVNSLRQTFRESVLGRKTIDAWWGIQNRGIIGDIRNKIGIRNPYQEMLNKSRLDMQRHAEHEFQQLGRKYGAVRMSAPVEVREVAQEIIEEAEYRSIKEGAQKIITPEIGTVTKEVDRYIPWENLLNSTDVQQKIIAKLGDDGVRQVGEFATKATDLMKELSSIEKRWEMLGWGTRKELYNYLPTFYKDQASGGMGQAIGKVSSAKRMFTRTESGEMQQAMLRDWLKIDAKDAKELFESGGGNYVHNLDELILARFAAHSKLSSRVNMVKKMKELGVPIDTLTEGSEQLTKAYHSTGAQINKLGLTTIPHDALKGMAYDTDVADILTNALNATGKDIKGLKRLFVNYTKWFKGTATATPGFHFRNHFDNEITGFLIFGPRWFTTLRKNKLPAIAGVAHALNISDPKKWFSGTGIDNKTIQRLLKQRVGNFTVEELAEIGGRKGVIARTLQGLDAPNTYDQAIGKKATTWNPVDMGLRGEQKEFKAVAFSRGAGNYVENIPRFQAFIMSYRDIVAENPKIMDNLVKDGLLTKAGKISDGDALEYAAQQAKKWFMDYEDLTSFEKNVMKNIIPFYTWIRKNLARQISGIVLYPGMFSLIPKLEEEFKMEDGNYDPSLVPEYMRQLGYFAIGSREKGQYSMFNPNIGIQDFARIPLEFDQDSQMPHINWKELKDDIMGASHPLIKSVVEMIPDKGYDVWRKRDLDERANAPYTLRLFTKKPELLLMVDGFLRRVGVKKGLDMEKGADGKLKMNAKITKLIENNLPVLRTFEHLFQTTVAVIPGMEEILEDATEAKSDYDKTERLFQLLAWWGGIKMKQVDMGEQQDWLDREIGDKARAMKKDAGRDVVRLRTQNEGRMRLR